LKNGFRENNLALVEWGNLPFRCHLHCYYDERTKNGC